MKFLVVAVILVASVVADVSHVVNSERADQLRSNQVYPQQQHQIIPILRQAQENNGFGNYKFNYETGNGIQVTEESELKNPGTQDEAENAHGSYSYVGDDGVTYTVNWIADEYGFRASGAHIPDSIQKSLQQIPQNVQAQAVPVRDQQVANRFVQVQEPTPVRPQQFTSRFVQVQEPVPVRAQQLTSRFVQVQEPAPVRAQQLTSRFVQVQEPTPVRAQQLTSRFVQVQEPAQQLTGPFVQVQEPVQVRAQQITGRFVQVQEPAPVREQLTSRFVQGPVQVRAQQVSGRFVQEPAPVKEQQQFINRFVAA